MMHLQMAIPSLDLRELRTSDADNLYQLIQFNRAHLTRLVDYTNYVELSVTELHAKLVATNAPEQTLDVNFENLLISAVSLIKYHTTESVRKLILLAKDEFCAKEIWTGITPTNSASINLVTRLSFKLTRRQETRLRLLLRRGNLSLAMHMHVSCYRSSRHLTRYYARERRAVLACGRRIELPYVDEDD